MKVAIVHDWLVTLGGAELVLREMLRVFPDASVFTLIDAMSAEDREFLGVRSTKTSFLKRIPGAASRHRSLLPLFPTAVRSLDMSGYDLVISNSHAVANGARTTRGQLHVSFCHSPMRYAWDLRDQYLRESGLDHGAKGILARGLLERLRRWDRSASASVQVFIAPSRYIAGRIKRAYDRDAFVVHSPVDTEFFTPDASVAREDFFVTASRFVPYKRIDLIVRAFSRLTDMRLIVVGAGPDDVKVRTGAGPNVSFTGHAPRGRLRDLLRRARAFIFAADEDFGIAPIEAQACGAPVIAYGHGGVLETVIPPSDARSPTGLFYPDQTEDSLVAGMRRFEALRTPIADADCRQNAERFSEARFRKEFGDLVHREWRAWTEQSSSGRF